MACKYEDQSDQYSYVPVITAQGRRFTLNASAVDYLLSDPGLKSRKILIISATGNVRIGKSFLLNNLHAKFQEKASSGTCFPWGGGTQHITEGILISKTPVIYRGYAILFLDTHGLHAISDKVDEMIFTIVDALSSIHLFNVKAIFDSTQANFIQRCDKKIDDLLNNEKRGYLIIVQRDTNKTNEVFRQYQRELENVSVRDPGHEFRDNTQDVQQSILKRAGKEFEQDVHKLLNLVKSKISKGDLKSFSCAELREILPKICSKFSLIATDQQTFNMETSSQAQPRQIQANTPLQMVAYHPPSPQLTPEQVIIEGKSYEIHQNKSIPFDNPGSHGPMEISSIQVQHRLIQANIPAVQASIRYPSPRPTREQSLEAFNQRTDEIIHVKSSQIKEILDNAYQRVAEKIGESKDAIQIAAQQYGHEVQTQELKRLFGEFHRKCMSTCQYQDRGNHGSEGQYSFSNT